MQAAYPLTTPARRTFMGLELLTGAVSASLGGSRAPTLPARPLLPAFPPHLLRPRGSGALVQKKPRTSPWGGEAMLGEAETRGTIVGSSPTSPWQSSPQRHWQGRPGAIPVLPAGLLHPHADVLRLLQ